MRYVVINPCNGYVYKGNGFLVLRGYGGTLSLNAPLQGTNYIYVEDPVGNILDTQELGVWTDGSALTSNANALRINILQRPMLLVTGNKLSSSVGNSDAGYAIECDTLEEAAQLL